MERQWTQNASHNSIRFKRQYHQWIVAGPDWKLMNDAVRMDNRPSGAFEHSADLGEQENAIERLVRAGSNTTASKTRVNAIQPHGVEIIRRRQIEQPAGSAYARHFLESRQGVRQMLNCFAGNYNVERLAGEREPLCVCLRECKANISIAVLRGPFVRDSQGRFGEIRAKHSRAFRCKKSGKPSAATSNFEHVFVFDRREILKD